MISLLLLFSCEEETTNTTTSSLHQEPQLENGFCEEPDISKIPVGNIDCLDDICFVEGGSFWRGSAEALDEYSEGYLRAFHLETRNKTLLSEKILADMDAEDLEFQDYALNHSKKIAKRFIPLDVKNFSTLKNSAQTSMQKLRNLEESSSMDINKYVELYNSKI